MKTVRIHNGVVAEIIPHYALPPEKWYGAEFAAKCLTAPDEVEQGWVYKDGVFSPPSNEPVETTPTALEQLRADVDFIALMQGVTL